MKQRLPFSSLILAVSLLFSAGIIWAQTTPAPEKDQTKMKQGKGERTGEEKMEVRGSQDSDRMERKKGDAEMDARGTQKPGPMDKSGHAGVEGTGNRSERWATQDIKKAQEALKNKGHDPGSTDGVMGPQTSQAIRAFQSANGLKETGRLDPETAKKLGVEQEASSERRTSSKDSTPKQKEPSSAAGK
jgi:murein L,D-transpeptidase YcbB/YkuD